MMVVPAAFDHIAADLFCGAGGTSSGLLEAAAELGLQIKLIAVNHWDVAIATHSENHSFADHYCEAVENLDPRKVVPQGYLRLLVASPECRYHSNARGGRAINDQLRTSPWDILRWMEALYIEDVLIENVPEFRDWGPLDEDGRKIKAKKGQIFLEYIRTMRALGYKVDYRVLNAADFGDPTTRERLFILARRKHRVRWPEPTHTRTPDQPLLDGRRLQPWRTAREIIDWSIPGESIYGRKKPLAENTMRRIAAGLRKFSGLPFIIGTGGPVVQQGPQSVDKPMTTVLTQNRRGIVQPFLVQLNGTRDEQLDQTARSTDQPLPTVAGNGSHFGLVQPFLIGQQSGAAPRSVDAPVPTVATAGAISLIQPFLLSIRGGNDGYTRGAAIDAPVPTVTTVNPMALVQPFIVNMAHTNDGAPAGDPFIIATNHGSDGRRVYPLTEPMRTVTTVDAWAIVQPFLVEYHGKTSENGERLRSIDDPMPTIATANQHGLVQPYLVKYYSSGADAVSVDEPLPTVTTKDRFGLVEPLYFVIADQLYMLDILFRMLLPHELAAAQGFRPGYRFTGKREDVVKQIGNAVPRHLARALCRALLQPSRPRRSTEAAV